MTRNIIMWERMLRYTIQYKVVDFLKKLGISLEF